jgi:uncharacterized OB-fold protein
MSERQFPDPSVTMESEVYWAACTDGKLLLKRCADCGKLHFYPRAICPYCMSDATEWVEASGAGHIYSFSVMRRADPPYAIAYVRLAEGVTMLSNIVDADFDALRVDQPVTLAFRNSAGGQAIPVFRPAEGTA